jgi:uncharacterized protein YmfQ (DUF2313 family)
MTACDLLVDDPFRCPTKWELLQQLLVNMPRGRAWQTHEDLAEVYTNRDSSEVGEYEIGDTGLGADDGAPRLTVMQQYWAAYASVLEYLHQRACALLEEMLCATTVDLRGEWGADYGFPDPCLPYDTLCEKVRAEGGATCAYFVGLAARLGYAIECRDCGAGAEAGCAEASLDETCVCAPSVMLIRILRTASPALVAGEPFEAGSAVAGCTPPCPPVPDDLVCLINRLKPAHVKALFEVVE